MAILPIYLYGTKVLKQTAKPVEKFENSIVKLIYNMFETMRNANGIGLAAPQVGVSLRVITIDISDVKENNAEGEKEDSAHPTSKNLPRILTLINPQIISEENTWSTEEGCLSVPGIHAQVERPEFIKVKFYDGSFKQQEILADGLLARVILHELDHLNGILFIDRINKAKKSMLLTKLKNIKNGKVETDYDVIYMNEED